jgi:hypothetical protein
MEWPEFPTAGRVRVRHKRRPRKTLRPHRWRPLKRGKFSCGIHRHRFNSRTTTRDMAVG